MKVGKIINIYPDKAENPWDGPNAVKNLWHMKQALIISKIDHLSISNIRKLPKTQISAFSKGCTPLGGWYWSKNFMSYGPCHSLQIYSEMEFFK